MFYTHINTYTYIHTYMYTHIYRYIYIYVYIFIYVTMINEKIMNFKESKRRYMERCKWRKGRKGYDVIIV